MFKYILKRVAASAVTLLLVAAITFLAMNAIPGNPFLDENTTVEQMEIANAKYGLDQPLLVQMKNYLLNYLHGDMGESLKMQRGTPVKDIIFGQGKFELSIQLGVLALFLTVLMGIPLGCIAAYNRGKAVDNFLNVFSTVGIAAPNFVVATLLLTLLSVKLGILPAVSGSFNDPKAIIMPAIALSLYYVCYVAKLTRTSMLDAINQDYIRTARAKGLRTGSLIFKHALRNALIPVVTYLGPLTAGLLCGGFVVETTFGVPGLGRYFVSSIIDRDYPIIMATTIVLSTLIIGMNLIVDIVYKIVDPRISLSGTNN
ncbi:ABC transporter permease [Blautia sp. OF03-15BH]|uniref:ABC transporter permease n=1 Tax=Blautia sp. OF03-15BH TaxID=2292287 RepID=UPI000E48B641|nr:ABC transporter permease [Blautia sp. OF03-15BH]RGY01154.1 ABC transporter permease [Blautia sp. OF03-15BH]